MKGDGDMDNLNIYNLVRGVPDSAQKIIGGGRLKGMTDVNPMWRIKMLTEVFGPCGVGWKYEIKDKRLENAADGSVAAFMDIDLYIRHDGSWSDAIPGTGGSMFASNEKNGLYVSDECFKMALTDAISVACKALGMAADIYWDKDRTKYSQAPEAPSVRNTAAPICRDCGGVIKDGFRPGGELWPANEIAEYTAAKYKRPLCSKCATEAKKAMKEAEKNAVDYADG
mgnify:FL=1